MYKLLAIGIDQSYTRTGISIALDGKLKKVTSTEFRGSKCKSDKRKMLSNIIHTILEKNKSKASEVIIICERIRTFTKGTDFGLRPAYLKSTGALIATIVDAAHEHGVKVYSADTRSWKSQVVGTSKGGKVPTIKFVEKLGFDLYLRTNKKGVKIYDDDAADSACMALYGSCKGRKLKLEE